MTKAFVLVHDDIKSDVIENLYIDTGEMVQVDCRDPIMEPILDEDGNPTGEEHQTGWGDPYPCEREKVIGGFVEIGVFPKKNGDPTPWTLMLISSTGARLQTIANGAGNQMIPLAVIQPGDGRVNLKSFLSEDDLDRMNNWLGNNNYPEIPETWNIGRIIKGLIKAIEPDLDLIDLAYDIAEIE